MNRSETATLLALAAAFDRRTVGDADVRAWQTVLADIDYEQAQAAVTHHYANTRNWVMPADIREHVRRLRDQAAADLQGPGLAAEVPDADPDDVPAYLDALRAQRNRAALGEPLRRRPVAELISSVGRTIPAEHAAVRRPGPLGVECPRCQAPAGRPCHTTYQRRRMADVHPARLDASRAA
ncbi:zinc finger domain-containing protein [Kitasatospora sp. NPDC054939]